MHAILTVKSKKAEAMKKWILCLFVIFSSTFLFSQNDLIGTVSYKSQKNVYVKFTDTDIINIGDTLILHNGEQRLKALVVKQKSSTSCVTENLSQAEISVGQKVVFEPNIQMVKPDIQVEDLVPIPVEATSIVTPDSVLIIDDKSHKRKQITTGRLTLSTNASINPDDQNHFQRIRAAASFNFQNIHQSAFSFQTYVTYRHRYGIDQNSTDFYDDFKVFSCAVQYAPSAKYNLSLGRKINNNIANMGAIDGLQGEYVMGKYTTGLFLGTRPDFTNFTFNAQLPQFGVYLVRNDQTTKGAAQTSVAIAEQQNDFKTDRRFIYFQHNNSLVKNLNLFLSSEIDLYENIKGETSTKPKMTSIYASLRYRVLKNLSFSGSYDNRRNIIYYESFQTFIDQLVAQETRQGFRLQSSYSPFKKVNINASAFYRYQGSHAKPTSNYIANINFNSILKKSTSASVNINLLESFYFKGVILGGRISDNFFKGKLNTEVNYRNINYTFFNTETGLKQNIAGVNFSIHVLKKTTLMLSYEGTFEQSRAWHRYFITMTQRIKN